MDVSRSLQLRGSPRIAWPTSANHEIEKKRGEVIVNLSFGECASHPILSGYFLRYFSSNVSISARVFSISSIFFTLSMTRSNL